MVNPAPKPRQISEKRRADNAAFQLWIEENQHDLSKRVPKIEMGDAESANALLRDFENRRIITNPRDYQLELFERAKTENTIAVLDTGSGKTLIAALLLRWTLQNELEDRAKGAPKRIAFFLVDKVALVFQQHAVLTCNLDYPIEKLCGEMISGTESKEFWAKMFEDNMAIVCTADILNSCLHHSWIRMNQINLLVFDEAHHTKKNHPYARIIKDFYFQSENAEKRPRILGMTASPVDSRDAPEKAAAELEALLHSRIATVADPTVLQSTISAPKTETVIEYDRSPVGCETELQRSLKALVDGHDMFRQPFAFTRHATSELGPWIADRFWQLYFKEGETVAMEAQTIRNSRKRRDLDDVSEQHINQLREARRLVGDHPFLTPTLDQGSLSGKVIKLVEILQEQYLDADRNRKCIVFVNRRKTALLLADLLQQPEIRIPGLQVGVLMGGGTVGSGYESKVSFRDQVLTILKFRRGEFNCIIATSVAEEGLDIPDCNVIIRFDLYDTLIQYIQSRGRARQAGSEYIHLVERGNGLHLNKIAQNKKHEDALRNFCAAMPEDRKLTGNNYNMDYFLRKERGQKQYTVPETGAKLSYPRSLIYLATFTASLPHPPEVVFTPEYVVSPVLGGFQCEVMMPSTSPISNAVGKIHTTKAVAKCSAAFEMCLALLKGKYLDEHLRPIFTKQLPAMRNARLAISSRKRGDYDMRLKPEIWSSLGAPTELHVMAIALANPSALGRPSSPLLLLTRQPIPEVAPFHLFFGTDRSSQVLCTPVAGSVKLHQTKLESLAAFTFRIFKDVFSKEYEPKAEDLPYFLAPSRNSHAFGFSSASDANGIIRWETLDFVRENDAIEYSFDKPDDFFQNKFISDPWDGSRKFYLRRRRHDLKPTDPVPEGVVPPRHRAWRISCKDRDILNYSNSLWSNARSRFEFSADQPVVEAELLPIRRNLLDDNIDDEDMEAKRCFLVLEPLKISSLPVDVTAMALNFPAIIHRIDSALIALDACRMLGLEGINPKLALEAFTKDSDNSDEHDAEKVNFQVGMGNNYERLEFLGDSFLKMATTISLYTVVPDKREFEYHVERMLLICNRNLFNNALEVKLEEYIRSMAFSRRTWYPENLTLIRGKRNEVSRRHVLADKSIADVCEALIGAAYLTTRGRGGFDMAVQAVTAVVKDPKHKMKAYSDYYAAYEKPKWQTTALSVTQTDMAERFSQRMGYTFKHPQLLRSAFHHPSYPSSYENLPSYQRLEFLGDALLDMVCVDHLFHRFPAKDPQWLTEHKMAMVSNHFLGCLAYTLGFHKSILANSAAIQRDLAEYMAEMDEAVRAAKEEAASYEGGTEDGFRRGFWQDCSRPPKCLSDVLEAYIGAVFVDSEYNYGEVQAFFEKHVYPWFEDMEQYDAFASKHPVTFLGTMMQTQFHCHDWRLLVKETGVVAVDGADAEGGGLLALVGATQAKSQQIVCAIWVHGKVLAHATSSSSRYGKITAAKEAIKVLEKMGVEKFKALYGCQCVAKAEGVLEAYHGSAI
ncbi:dicer-like protein 1 [Lasiosphaeris hirsuta]|uniref:Dicer-like protein 1 n=1 Tax=Lasiosphaeris hirsuta TaxID=260670 RepID=A0AA40DU98_9PEZI|nr:dicer-like protein 1 [Lasiosphaeris hirsuta]